MTTAELLASPEAWLSLATLTGMEIVLGIDNIVFITILCGRLPDHLEHKARRIGIGVALFSRLLLLFAISWIVHLTDPIGNVLGLFTIPFSGRDAILFGGGVFLVGKATHEIYENVEHPGQQSDLEIDENAGPTGQDVRKLMASILAQVIVLDIVFSLDSVITAVGMVDEVSIMATAMIIAVGVMMVFAGPVGDFVQDNPSVRILALAFLVLIGTMLVMEGMGQHVSKGYIYAAMGFSLSVELVNLRRLKKLKAAAAVPATDGDAVELIEARAKIRGAQRAITALAARASMDVRSKLTQASDALDTAADHLEPESA